jgi:protocatechuate 3,4-dioxygenase beta subunit
MNWMIRLTLIVLFTLGTLAAAALDPTPHTGAGPFFPPDDGREADNDLTQVPGSTGAPEGQLLYMEGRVTNTAGEPLANTKITIWQTDVWGKYDHPREQRMDASGKPVPKDPNFQYWGRTTTDADGRYVFKTIVPGNYGRPEHIHCRFDHADYKTLDTEMQFAGDPKIEGDFVTGDLEGRDRLPQKLLEPREGQDPKAKRAVFDVVLAR